MKKKIAGLFLSSVSVLALFSALVLHGTSNLSESTLDNSNVSDSISVRRLIGTGEERDISPTYVQPGVMIGGEHDGAKCMRFVTAVKGNYKSLTYHRSIDGGEEATFPVDVLYEGVQADHDSSVLRYYNGSEPVADDSYKGNYYWACYIVAFGDNSEYLSKDFNVYLTATYVEEGETKSEQTNSKVTSYEEIAEAPVQYPYGLKLYDGVGGAWLQLELSWTDAEYKVSNKSQISFYIMTGSIKTTEAFQLDNVTNSTENSIKISRSTNGAAWVQDAYSTIYVTVINDAEARYDLSMQFNGKHENNDQIFPSKNFNCVEVERVSHTVSFDANYEGAEEIDSKTVYEDDKYGTLPDLSNTREGYEFLGWFTEAEAGDEVDDSSIVSAKDDHTLYAHWLELTSALPYRVELNYTDGAWIRIKLSWTDADYKLGALVDSFTVSSLKLNGDDFNTTGFMDINNPNYNYVNDNEAGAALLLPSAVFSGVGSVLSWTIDILTANSEAYQLTFNSVTKENNKFTINDLVVESVVLTYKTVAFDVNYEGGTNPDSVKYIVGKKYGELPDVKDTREGYKFLGWFTEAEEGEQIEANAIVEGENDLTLYAHWISLEDALPYDVEIRDWDKGAWCILYITWTDNDNYKIGGSVIKDELNISVKLNGNDYPVSGYLHDQYIRDNVATTGVSFPNAEFRGATAVATWTVSFDTTLGKNVTLTFDVTANTDGSFNVRNLAVTEA